MDRTKAHNESFVGVAVYMSVVGPAVFIVQPGLVQAFVTYLGFSEQQAGAIAAIEMWGIALTTIVMTALAGRINYHFILRAALVTMIFGNLLSSIFQSFEIFSLARLAVGIGSGVLISLGFIIIGKTSNPDRNFGHLVMWVLLFGAVTLALMPTILNAFGISGMLLVFTLMYLAALPLVRRLPQSLSQSALTNTTVELRVSGLSKSLSIVGVLIFFTGVGVIWTYLALIGSQTGASEQNVAFALTGSQIIGAGGALSAAMIGNRFGRFKPTLMVLILCVVSLATLFGHPGFALYIIAVCLFNFSYNFFHPFSYALLALFDSSAEIIKFAVAAQMLGLAIGPSIAAMVVSSAGYNNVVLVSVALFALTLLAFCLPIFQLADKRQPAT
jgi:predicted MFS family arabinose efflux permease